MIARRLLTVLGAMLAALLTLSACVAVSSPGATQAISKEALRNATYSGIYDTPVTLTDGQLKQVIEGQPFTLQYVDNQELHGDLDGDGVQDVVVFLVERGGGSGAFTYVAAQLNRGGKPIDAGAVRIEDRIGVKSAAVKDGQVVMEIITQGPGDVACCSSHKSPKTYSLENGKLVEVAGKDQALKRISAADLNGTSWTLLELTEGQPAPSDPQVTISFGEDRISGFGGCNNFTSRFSLGDVMPLVMTTSSVTATGKACPGPILGQETAYFTALQNVSHWGYVYGRLALYYKDDSGKLNRLLFALATK